MEMMAFCIDCRQGFSYTRGGPHSRHLTRCPKHQREHELELNKARVAKCRAKKREAKNPPNKQTRSGAPRLARGGVDADLAIYHVVKGKGKKTMCGLPATSNIPASVVAKHPDLFRQCKKCTAAMEKAGQ